MKFYKVKFMRVAIETEKAICLKQWGRYGDIWLPKKLCRQIDGYNEKSLVFLVPDFIVEAKNLDGKLYEPYHRPEKIEPVYNQEAIDELKV